MSHVSRRSVLQALVSTVGAAGVAGCAGRPSTTRSSTAPIVLGYSAWPGWWPWAIAERRDLFRKNGVTVQLRWYDNYLQSVEDLAAGRIDANSQTISDTLVSTSRDDAIRQAIVLVNDISDGNDKVIARAGIDSVRGLKGRRVAVEPGVVDDFLLTRALVKAGLTRDDVTIVPLETSKAEQAFVDGSVDAFAAFPPYWSRGLAVPGAREIASSAEFPWTIWDVLAVDRRLIAERPEAVQAIVDTWADVLDYMTLERDDAFSILAERAGVDVSDERALVDFLALQDGTRIYSMEDMREAFSPGTSPDRLVVSVPEQAGFLVDNGFVASPPDTSRVLEPRFVRSAEGDAG